MAEKEPLKVLRVVESAHQAAKINAAQQGINLQTYIEQLIKADTEGKIAW